MILIHKKFWRNVHKVSNSKASAHVISAGGVSGVHEVADMWKVHFEKLYNSKTNSKYQSVFEQKVREHSLTDGGLVITVTDVIKH